MVEELRAHLTQTLLDVEETEHATRLALVFTVEVWI